MLHVKKNKKKAISWKIPVFIFVFICLSTMNENYLNKEQMSSSSELTTSAKFEKAKTESFGFFYDIDDNKWNLLKEIFLNHENHKFPEKPLTHNPSYDKRKMSYFNSEQAWYQSNYEPNFSCQFEKRIGWNMNGDGPKWICDPHRIKYLAMKKKNKNPNHPGCVIYSIGSNGDFSFEMGLQKELGVGTCEYHIFDMGDYESKMPKELERAFYHQWGLMKQRNLQSSSELQNGQKFYGLKDTIKLLGHEKLEKIDVFKIDCEKCEWKTFRDWFAEGIPMLHQIQVEVHGAPGQKALDFFDSLEEEGYVRFHKEPNIQFDPKCVEYAFIKLDIMFMQEKNFTKIGVEGSGISHK